MIDKFKELPETRQGLSIYINYAKNQIKKNERKIKSLQECIEEARARLGIEQEGDNAGLPKHETPQA